MSRNAIIALIVAVAILVIAAAIFAPLPATAPSGEALPETSESAVDNSSTTTEPPAETTALVAPNITGAAKEYAFTAQVPGHWQTEAIAGSQALSLYDPAAPGKTTLDKSQIFIRFFTANDFLTLSTVTIHSRQEQKINGRPAVVYDIEKKPSIAPFSNQPLWRSERHIVTDIRVSDSNPSVFYVIAKNPNLDDATYQSFLNSLKVAPLASAQNVVQPVANFAARITKKPFGIFITSQNSPVQPERFSGYHTGADVEYDDTAEDVPVRAIIAGTVLQSRTASGYGGVVVIQHEINGEPVVAIYGHLDPNSLVKVDTTVAAGQQIGILGDHKSSETDGERKHLHFALIPGTKVDLRGYVQSESELAAWRDPRSLFN